MSDVIKINIHRTLEEIGDAVMAALAYKRYPLDHLDRVIFAIDDLMLNPANRKECEKHLKSSGSNYVLFFLSNILYNLKQRGQLVLSEDVMKWLGSVWKNFLKRNKSYQEMFPGIDEYRIKMRKYYPGGGTFVSQIDNVNLVKDDFVLDSDSEDSPIRKLERFYQAALEILNAMKPSYFFLLDYHYEKKMSTGMDSERSGGARGGGAHEIRPDQLHLRRYRRPRLPVPGHTRGVVPDFKKEKVAAPPRQRQRQAEVPHDAGDI